MKKTDSRCYILSSDPDKGPRWSKTSVLANSRFTSAVWTMIFQQHLTSSRPGQPAAWSDRAVWGQRPPSGGWSTPSVWMTPGLGWQRTGRSSLHDGQRRPQQGNKYKGRDLNHFILESILAFVHIQHSYFCTMIFLCKAYFNYRFACNIIYFTIIHIQQSLLHYMELYLIIYFYYIY